MSTNMEKEENICIIDYRKKIIDMVEHIKEKRFLKAIYISISDYLKENEPD